MSESAVGVRIARLAYIALLLAAISACVPSHAMRQGSDDGSCAARRALRPSADLPATEAGVSLVWKGPANHRDLEQNDVWCRTVGPPVLRALPRPGVARDTSIDSVAVLAWNVFLGGGDIEAFLAEELGFECGPSQAGNVAPPFHFVVLLQEVHRVSSRLPVVESGQTIPWRIAPTHPTRPRVDIPQVAERCGLAMAYVPSARNGPTEADRSPEDKGNAILSTLPLTELTAIELPFEAARKVAIAATIEGPGGGRVRVTTVHLDMASTLARVLMTGNATRLRQALGLIEALDSMESLPTVLGGDFNTWSAYESTMKRLALEFPDSPTWDGETTRGVFPTDHILFRTGQGGSVQLVEGSYRKISEQYGSDHAARIIWLRGRDAGSFGHANQIRQ